MAIVEVGRILGRQFRVEKHLASTGMSDVYRVWDMNRNVPLAMKVLRGDLEEDPSLLRSFKREAQALKKLNHPNIVPFYGLYQEDDLYFLLELFIEGPNLKDILSRLSNRMMPIVDTLIVMKPLCSALGYAHMNDVVHCDIKPGNVMVDRGGMIYLTDFGIARHSDSSVTTNAGAGTAAYMAPEQILEDPLSSATDVYAMGIMVYEMLAGRRPFRGDDEKIINTGRTTEERLRNAHLRIEPPDPRRFGADLSDEQVQVILKALNKRPNDRYQTPQEFFEALCAASRSLPEMIPGWYGGANGISNISVDHYQDPPIVKQHYNQVSPSEKLRHNQVPKWVFGLIGFVVIGLFILIIKPGGSKPLPDETKATAEEVTEILTIQSVSEATSTIPATISLPSDEPLGIGSTKISPKDEMVMVYIPAGEFLMGSDPNVDSQAKADEKPQHLVNLDAFWIDKTEVTNSMFSKFVSESNYVTDAEKQGTSWIFTGPEWENINNVDWLHPQGQNSNIDGLENHPVVHVSWNDAVAYCLWAGRNLPSEAEWEKAARGTDGRIYPWGNKEPTSELTNLADINLPAKWADSSLNDNYKFTSPVGNYPSGVSPYGALDMAGNVWEWVNDWYDKNYYTQGIDTNPEGPSSGKVRVQRGGSWDTKWDYLRSAYRGSYIPTNTNSITGFRCVE